MFLLISGGHIDVPFSIQISIDCEQSLIFLCKVTARETQPRESSVQAMNFNWLNRRLNRFTGFTYINLKWSHFVAINKHLVS